jgi:hypothetical protein
MVAKAVIGTSWNGHHFCGLSRGIDIEPDDVSQFVDEARVVGQLELPGGCG